MRRKKKKEKAPRLVLPQLSADLRRKMNNMTKLLDLHELVDLDGQRLADAVDVVSGQVDEHDVLGPVLFAREQTGTEGGVLCC